MSTNVSSKVVKATIKDHHTELFSFRADILGTIAVLSSCFNDEVAAMKMVMPLLSGKSVSTTEFETPLRFSVSRAEFGLASLVDLSLEDDYSDLYSVCIHPGICRLHCDYVSLEDLLLGCTHSVDLVDYVELHFPDFPELQKTVILDIHSLPKLRSISLADYFCKNGVISNPTRISISPKVFAPINLGMANSSTSLRSNIKTNTHKGPSKTSQAIQPLFHPSNENKEKLIHLVVRPKDRGSSAVPFVCNYYSLLPILRGYTRESKFASFLAVEIEKELENSKNEFVIQAGNFRINGNLTDKTSLKNGLYKFSLVDNFHVGMEYQCSKNAVSYLLDGLFKDTSCTQKIMNQLPASASQEVTIRNQELPAISKVKSKDPFSGKKDFGKPVKLSIHFIPAVVDSTCGSDVIQKSSPAVKFDKTGLLVRGGLTQCMVNPNHQQISTEITVSVFNKQKSFIDVKTKANYCHSCKQYYISDFNYHTLTCKGIPCCRTISRDKYNSDYSYYGKLNEESVLHQYGYNVNQQEDLPDSVRQNILEMIVRAGIWSKPQTISFLEWCVRRAARRKNFKSAISRWQDDILFLRDL